MKYAMPVFLALVSWLALMTMALSDAISLFIAPLLNIGGLFFSVKLKRSQPTFITRLVMSLCMVSLVLMFFLYCYGYLLGSSWDR